MLDTSPARGTYAESTVPNSIKTPEALEVHRALWTQASIPYGLCLCGCGAKTVIAPQSHRQKGWLRGEPQPWLMGHQLRKSSSRYLLEDRGHATPC